MPHRFNDRENGESFYFPRKHREQQEWRFPEQRSRLNEWREWEAGVDEPVLGEPNYPRQSRHRFESSEPGGEYAPSPWHARRGQDVRESYGGYSGQQYRRGIYGYKSPRRETFSQYGESRRNEPFDPNYGFAQSRRQRFGPSEEREWRREPYQDFDYASAQRHSQYEQGPFFGRGPKGYRRSDERIEEDINERLTQHPFVDATDVEVRVQNGEVIISGTVDDRNAKRITEDIVDSVSGVKDVQNQLRIHRKLIQNQ